MLTQMDVGKRGTRFEYVPTQKAKDFQIPLMAILQWGDRWVSGPGNEPVHRFRSRKRRGDRSDNHADHVRAHRFL